MRTIIIGPCRSGKSSLARELRSVGIPTFCGDPKSEAKDVEDDVTYLPEGLPISGKDGAAQWIADNWFTMPGPWCCESWVMARALRRWLAEHPQGCPGEVTACVTPRRTSVSTSTLHHKVLVLRKSRGVIPATMHPPRRRSTRL